MNGATRGNEDTVVYDVIIAGAGPVGLFLAGELRYVANDAKERLGLSALLVRPDGFVAWASETTPSAQAVARAAGRWFGALADS